MNNISPKELNENIFKLIGDKWMLISAAKADGSINTMTASWGGAGVLWNKNVCFIFIRPQRYTREFTDEGEHITLSFYPEEYRNSLMICGRKSGRDCDKISEAGLKTVKDGDKVYFEGADIVLHTKKLYRGKIEESDFVDKVLAEKNYPEKDYHYVYVCEIISCETKE